MRKIFYFKICVGIIFLFCSNAMFAQVQGGANLDPNINGQNVGMVIEQSAQSVFKWVQITDNSWNSTNTTAQRDQGTFTQTGRDEWSVYLTSDKTGRKFQIDLYQKKVIDRSTGLETSGDITQVGLRGDNSSAPNPPSEGWTAFDPGAGYFFITNLGNNKVVDVAGSRTAVSTNVGIYGKHGGKNQKFRFLSKGSGYYVIETALKQNILFAINNSGKTDNTNIKLNNPVGVQQHFKLEKNAAGEIRMTSKLADDLYLGANDAGNNLVVRKGEKGKKTVFSFTPTTVENSSPSTPTNPTGSWTAYNPGTGYFFITNLGNNKVIDVAGSKTAVSTNVGIYGKHGGNNQKFRFISKGGGYYVIETALKQNILFAINNSGKTDNTNVKLNNSVGVQQYFKLEKNAAGQIRMTSKLADDLYLGANDAGNNLVVRKGDKGNKILYKFTPTTVSNSNSGGSTPNNTQAGKITMNNTAKTFVVTIKKVGDSDFEQVVGPNKSVQVDAKIGDVFMFETSSDGFEALPYTVSKIGGTHKIIVGERYTSGKGNKLPNVKANRYSFDLKKVDPIFIDYTKTQAIKDVKGKTVGYGGMRKEIFEPLKNQDIDWNNQDGDYATKNHFSYDLLMETNASTETKMFYSSSAYEESFSANVGASTPKGGGSASFSHTSSNSSSETNIYSYSRTKVRAYEVTLKKDFIALTSDFKSAVKKLPTSYNSGTYKTFINNWGTHYPVSTTYGGVQVAAYKFNAKEVMESESMAIGVEGNVKAASVGGGYSSSSAHKQTQENSNGMHRAKGGTGTGENFSVDMSNSVPIEIDLKRLHELLLAKYFNDGTTDSELSARKANLAKAITEYIGSATDNGKSLKPRMYKMSDIKWRVTKADDLEVYGWVKYKVTKGNTTLIDKKPWSRSDSNGARVNTKHGTTERISGGYTVAVTAENGAVNPANYKFNLSAELWDDVWDGDEKIGSGSKSITLDKVNTSGKQRISFSLSDEDGTIEVSAQVEEIQLGFDH